VQELLGHSSIALTLGTYSHLFDTMHDQAAEEMDALFGEVFRRDRLQNKLQSGSKRRHKEGEERA
jgi:hypothetical protein